MNKKDLSPLWTLNNSRSFWTFYSKKTKTEPCDFLPSLAARRRNPRTRTKEVNQGGSTIPRHFTFDTHLSALCTYFLSGNGDHWLWLVAALESCPAGRWALNFFSSGIRLYEACVAAEDTEGRNGGVTRAARALSTRPTFLPTDPLSPTSVQGLCCRAFPVCPSQCELPAPQPPTPCCPKPYWHQNATLIKSKALRLVLNTGCDNGESMITSTNEWPGSSRNTNDMDKINNIRPLLVCTMLPALCCVLCMLCSLNSHNHAFTRVLLFPFCRWQNWDLSNLPRAPQQVNGRGELQSPGPYPLCRTVFTERWERALRQRWVCHNQ